MDDRTLSEIRHALNNAPEGCAALRVRILRGGKSVGNERFDWPVSGEKVSTLMGEIDRAIIGGDKLRIEYFNGASETLSPAHRAAWTIPLDELPPAPSPSPAAGSGPRPTTTAAPPGAMPGAPVEVSAPLERAIREIGTERGPVTPESDGRLALTAGLAHTAAAQRMAEYAIGALAQSNDRLSRALVDQGAAHGTSVAAIHKEVAAPIGQAIKSLADSQGRMVEGSSNALRTMSEAGASAQGHAAALNGHLLGRADVAVAAQVDAETRAAKAEAGQSVPEQKEKASEVIGALSKLLGEGRLFMQQSGEELIVDIIKKVASTGKVPPKLEELTKQLTGEQKTKLMSALAPLMVAA